MRWLVADRAWSVKLKLFVECSASVAWVTTSNTHKNDQTKNKPKLKLIRINRQLSDQENPRQHMEVK